MRVLPAILVCVVAVLADRRPCGKGWEPFGQHCYKHFLGDPVTHSEAERKCVREGGHLASIATEEENHFLLELAAVGGKHSFSGQPWIGLKQANGEWKWTDNSRRRYLAWAPKEPNQRRGEACGLFCADTTLDNPGKRVIYGGKTGILNDYPCNKKSTRYICKKSYKHRGNNGRNGLRNKLKKAFEKTVIITKTVTTIRDAKERRGHNNAKKPCRQGWTPFGKHCYKHIRGPALTHCEAEEQCVRRGGHLASIATEEENHFLLELCAVGGEHKFSDQPWIGLKLVDGEWSWTDNSSRRYLNWAPREPNNLHRKEACGVFCADTVRRTNDKGIHYGGKTGVLNDWQCLAKSRRYICKTGQNGGGKIGGVNTISNRAGRNLFTRHTKMLERKRNRNRNLRENKNRRNNKNLKPLKEKLNETTEEKTGSSSVETQRGHNNAKKPCRDGWTPFRKHCYKHIRGPALTHCEAEEHCVKRGGHLASIATEEENHFLLELCAVGGEHKFSDQPWIGLKLVDGDWSWTDNSSRRYLNWAPREPNNLHRKEACGVFCADTVRRSDNKGIHYGGRTGVLNDWQCLAKSRRYICKTGQNGGPSKQIDGTPKKTNKKECEILEMC